TRDSEGAVVITFTDTGPGIPKEIEHRLFESFVTSGKKGGTGLGLAIVKKIAQEHGGTISVNSTPKGATFQLRLPNAADGEPGVGRSRVPRLRPFLRAPRPW